MTVFICYRRDDTEGEARALYTRLAEETDERHLFLDHDAIGAGDNWRDRIDAALRGAKAALIVIGPRWSDSLDAKADRGAEDVVRREIAACLSRQGVAVIPVLVKGAGMPAAEALPPDIRQLADRNAIEIRNSAWRDDTARLVKVLHKAGALPRARRHWWTLATTASALLVLGTGIYLARVEVPEIPVNMARQFAQPLIEKAGLRFAPREVESTRINGTLINAGARGMQVAVAQRPAAGTTLFRGQTVEVDLILREPYRLVCRGGGTLDSSAPGPDLQFERHPGVWSLDMQPGSCAWVTGPIVANQDPVLRPLGFKEQLPRLFNEAPGHMLTFCAFSEYDQPNPTRLERLVALNYRQFLSPDDNGRLNPTVAGHVCDERL